ncbi:MAG TPA: MFS transporter [Myxococcales bacterium]
MEEEGKLRLASPRGRGVVAAAVLGSSVAFLDSTVVNVALPTLGRSLGASFAGLQWTVDGYSLPLCSLLLVGGALGDRFGRRRVFLLGLTWFGLASVLCSLANSVAVLVAARALQGTGAALLVPGSLALLRSALDERDQPAAIGAWAGLSGVATAAGPLAGGYLVEAVSWRAIFVLNVPLIAAALFVARRCVPESGVRQAGPLDLAGAVAALLGLGLLTWGLIDLPSSRRGGPLLVAAGAAGVVLFLLRERRAANPMLPLGIFRSRQFAGANLTTLAVYFALGGATFLLVLYLQRVAGYSPLAAGASLLPVTALVLVLSPVMGRLVRRIGLRLPMTVGPLVIAAGLFLLSRLSAQASYAYTALPGIALLGLGLGLTVAPLTSAALTGAGERFAGVASAVNNAVARVAGLLAVALLPLAAGGLSSDPRSLAQGFPAAMRLAAFFCLAGAAIAAVTIPGAPARRPA